MYRSWWGRAHSAPVDAPHVWLRHHATSAQACPSRTAGHRRVIPSSFVGVGIAAANVRGDVMPTKAVGI